MNLQELALLMNISKEELIDQLNNNHTIKLKLTEKKKNDISENFKIEVL